MLRQARYLEQAGRNLPPVNSKTSNGNGNYRRSNGFNITGSPICERDLDIEDTGDYGGASETDAILACAPSRIAEGGVTSAGGHPEKKEVSKHISFYKEFGRPISKVFLMAFFTYQAFYWIWLKLEKEEIQREKEKEVMGLMAEVERLRAK